MAIISKNFYLKYLLTALLNYDKVIPVMKGRKQSIVQNKREASLFHQSKQLKRKRANCTINLVTEN